MVFVGATEIGALGILQNLEVIIDMALPFIRFVPPSHTYPAYRAETEASTLPTLTSNFSPFPFFYPLFISGSSGKNSLLSSLLHQDSCFECDETAPDGVYVWPEPVQLGEISVMLLKMRSPVEEGEEYLEFRRKIRSGLVAMASVCVLCEDRSGVRRGIEEFMEDYMHIQGRPMEISKLMVTMEENSRIRRAEQDKITNLLSQYPGLIDLIHINRHSIDSTWTEIISNADFHRPYARSHRHFNRELPYIFHFLQAMFLYVRTASINISLKQFFTHMPDIRDPDAAGKITEIKEMAVKRENFYKYSQGVKFLKAGETLNPEVIRELQRNYKLREPTVVMVVMGEPGAGKSTLLNYIVQYCAEGTHLVHKFKVGNSAEHTTRNSLVLSHPIYYRKTQLMLIDLEGLGGVETRDTTLSILQKNLTSAILTLTSVPCLLINNTAHSARFIETTIARIAKLQTEFGFLIERIFLLFHDRDINTEENPNAGIVNLIDKLNLQHFEQRKVVKLMNKPNFVAAEADTQRSLFLHNFLENSLFVKKTVNGSPAKILDLLTHLSIISSHPSTDFHEFQLCESDKTRINDFIEHKKIQLEGILSQTQSRDDRRLLAYFNDIYHRTFIIKAEDELSQCRPILRNECRYRLEVEVEKIRGKLIGYEACYSVVKVVSEKVMCENITKVVDYYHNSAWCLLDFIPKVDQLEDKLKKMKSHYPRSDAKIESILTVLNQRKKYCIKWSSAVYAGQMILTVASLGIGAAIGASLTGARAGVTAAQATGMMVGRVVTGAVIGLGVGIGGNLVGGICTTLIFTEKAKEFVKLNRTKSVDMSGMKQLSDTPGRSLVPLLLLIGSKDTLVSEFANSFITQIAPFTPTEFQAFDPEKYAQVLSFEYLHPQVSTPTLSYIICLRMDKDRNDPHFAEMIKIAEALIPAASTTCLLVDTTEEYTSTLLPRIFPTTTSGGSVPSMTVVHKMESDIDGVRDILVRNEVTIKGVREYCSGNIEVVVNEVKGELDRSEPKPAAKILEKVKFLEAVFK